MGDVQMSALLSSLLAGVGIGFLGAKLEKWLGLPPPAGLAFAMVGSAITAVLFKWVFK